MNWQSALLVALLYFLVAFAVIRSIPRARSWVLILVGAPTIYFSVRWAAYRPAWLELLVGVAAALALLLTWWLLLGRRLSPPNEDNIRVWTEDDPF
jgi:hypothetical protein